jgi:hypothetical protein
LFHTQTGYWKPIASASNSGGGGFWDTFWDYFGHVPHTLSFIIPAVPFGGPAADLGLAIPFALIPNSRTVCAGLGVGVQAPAGGETVSYGILPIGNLKNAENILQGLSFSVGIQPTPARGFQVVGNSNGILAGPTAGVPGAAVTATYSGCVSFK